MGAQRPAPKGQTDNLKLVILDSHGDVRMQLDKPRLQLVLDGLPTPIALAIEMDEPKGHVTFHLDEEPTQKKFSRFLNDGPQLSMQFRLSDGKDLGSARGEITFKRKDWHKSLVPSFKASDFQESKLPQLGSFSIREQTNKTLVHAIREFRLDEQNRFGILRSDGSGISFALIATNGTAIRKIASPTGTNRESSITFHTAAVLSNRWVIIASEYGEKKTSRGWWISLETGELTPIPNFDAPYIEKVVGSDDGGFITLGGDILNIPAMRI
jgi:hypothetical protein